MDDKALKKVVEFKSDKNTLLRFAGRAKEKGEHEKSLRYLNRYCKIAPSDSEAIVALAEIYFEMTMYTYAKQTYFRALAAGADNDDVFFGLSMCMVSEGDYEAAEYYLSKIQNDVVGDMAEMVYQQRTAAEEKDVYPRLWLAKPPSAEYEQYIIERGGELVSNGAYGEALALLNKVQASPKNYKTAATLKIYCYTMNKNYNKAAELSEELLRREPDNTAALCSYYGILKMQEREKEAADVLAKLKGARFGSDNELLQGLQTFCMADSHSDVYKLATQVLERVPRQAEIELLKALAAYNLGEKTRAVEALKKTLELYGDFTSAGQYLEYIGQNNPGEIKYSLAEPYVLMLINAAMLETMLALDGQDFIAQAKADGHQLIKWGIRRLSEDSAVRVITKLSANYDKSLDDTLKELLCDGRIMTPVKHELVYSLVRYSTYKKIELVSENIYKEVTLPRISLKGLPKILADAYYASLAELIIIDVEPMPAIANLTAAMATARSIYEQGRSKGLNKIRSVVTLASVLSYLSEREMEYFDEKEFIDSYGVNRKLFDKYYRILTGGEDDNGN